ncbi:hypothetical protein NFI96_000237 [Prochilodus magdalenae]|nr:hypothetical protein NFI96_000237 [Prochilodus magdalenae]
MYSSARSERAGVPDFSDVIGDTVSVIGDTVSVIGDTVSVIGDTVSVIGDTVSVIGDTVSVIGDTVSVIEDTVSVIEDTVSVIDDTVSVIGDTVSVIGDTVSVIGDTVSVIGDTVSVTEDTESLIENTMSVIEDTLSVMGVTVSVIGDTVSVIGDTVSVIGDTVSVMEDTLSVIGDTVSVIGDTVSVIEDRSGSLLSLGLFATQQIGGKLSRRHTRGARALSAPLPTSPKVVPYFQQVTPISIKGVSVDTVEDYKYLGVHIDNKLDWSKNTDALYRKGQSRLYFLRRLRSFNICRTMLRIFYESVVASAILYAVACWGSRLRVADANRLNKLIRKASDVVGVELDSLMAVSERRTLSKLQTIMDNSSHPLYHTVMSHRSTFSARLIQPKCTTERHRRSFLPVAIRLYNSSLRARHHLHVQ